MRDWSRWLREGEHVLFAIVLATLVLLGTWWAVYLGRAIELERDHAYQDLALAVYLGAAEVEAGQDLVDGRLVISDPAAASPLAVAIGDSSDVVDVDPAVLAGVRAQHRRRRAMIIGETVLLMLLLVGCMFMLWRLVRARARAQEEVLAFTGQMTHEMKTPLVGLRALLETLKKGRVAADDLDELLALGLEQIDRQEHLVQTVLQSQRARLIDDALRAREVELSELVRRLVAHRSDSGVQFTVTGQGAARCDEDATWTILENLVDNARKHGAARVRLGIERSGSRLAVTCADDGRGFARDQAPHLFRAYESAHRDNAGTHGSGLGLFLSRRLARAMGGDLEGDSAGPGRGATFRLWLPYASGGSS